MPPTVLWPGFPGVVFVAATNEDVVQVFVVGGCVPAFLFEVQIVVFFERCRLTLLDQRLQRVNCVLELHRAPQNLVVVVEVRRAVVEHLVRHLHVRVEAPARAFVQQLGHNSYFCSCLPLDLLTVGCILAL